jgi:hypothetical protein
LQDPLAQPQGHGTFALVLPAHDKHAPLVGDVGDIRARPAQMVAVEVGKVAVVALVEVDQLAAAKPEAAASTHATLGSGDGRGCLVLAGLASRWHVPAGADPLDQVDQVDAGAGAARHRPDRAFYVLDLVAALAVEGETNLA